ncbi:hypothetical protein COW94_03915 [Candidatus Peregrinibacteria bacterium CG22_combo_CG10-13_8_21_14_all_44_10]|nr:MAG: hypothetical protein AUK45_03310 [Candidatus Peregrinibacteria bacterium CG2_30_44_17]PIP66023.1 MAG: hypothetical protein COW94_03915 [Candidatus Peregrinibacteria bacterium CG22_combo_CG10-13_8_21_14_all_44_10]PIS03515.1 MAG: hypothetical protein COT83_05595 [Candidatus Peregrinibacteria bacterium CG10_big_fil_rev_8_21_14_0_10_44_7]PIX80246.1 MAG: hypothetical protein COZ35_01305 [Candidatus Peregrinibacteria bacterium CG_4_10_14_3_um_filter_44_21]PJB89552.1 MAG: hypothetical protein 
MNRYVLGFAAMIAGILLMVYRNKIKDLTGNIGFAEQYLGVGGTWTFYALLGIASFIFGLMWMTGSFQTAFEGMFGNFF